MATRPRRLSAAASSSAGAARSRASATPRRNPLPATFAPQLATLVKAPPEGDQWLHELKYDGYRIGCFVDATAVRLMSRNGKDWTTRFPAVEEGVRHLHTRRALLDGEVTVVMPDGRTSFQALQNAFAGGGAAGQMVYFLFDLLHLDGEDISRLPLEQRKQRLAALLAGAGGVLRYADHFAGRGREVFLQACQAGAEGIVSKRRDLPYQPGRGPGWLKTKCVKRQEFVIGGFTDPQGSRVGIGALLVGVHDDAGRLNFAGKVGTGFTQKSARELRQQLEAIEQRACPFEPRPKGWLGGHAHWVRPQLVGEVEFTEWTEDGKIRHPSFQGLRADKSPAEVNKELPSAVRPAVRPRSKVPTTKSPAAPSRRARSSSAEAEVAGVRITHPDRVLYPDLGLTKLDLAKFYESIAEWILPHLTGRPLTLVRCPGGLGSSCFYMKHSNVSALPALRRVRIREKTKIGEYLIAESVEGLIALVQMSILELHTWNSKVEHMEEPDRIVLDLDPGPEVEWKAVVTAARLLRTALDGLGLESFVKTTGGHGLHVVVPLVPAADWSECLAFSRALAEAIVRLDPQTYTTNFAKAGRERKILIDYLRNNRTNTSVAAYSTRARPGAPVSAPITWDELTPRLKSDHYNVRNLGRRLERLGGRDPWEAYWKTRQRIPKGAVERLGG